MEHVSLTATGAIASHTESTPHTLSNLLLWVHYRIVHFEGVKAHQRMCESPHIPLLVAIGYVFLVHTAPRFLGDKPIPGLNFIVAVWNFVFSVGSMISFCYCAPILLRLMTTTDRDLLGLAPKMDRATGEWDVQPHVRGGLSTSLCYWNSNIFANGPTAFWILIFNLSKILELMDTVFLLLKRKPVAFIHWYHHVTVMLFCWHAHVSEISNGLAFAVMNMGVHSIMYLYYFMCACGLRRVVRPFAAMVTLLQTLQMITGLALILYTGYLYASHPGGCDTTAPSLIFGTVMYGSYVALFVKLFRDNYFQPKRIHRERQPSAKVG